MVTNWHGLSYNFLPFQKGELINLFILPLYIQSLNSDILDYTAIIPINAVEMHCQLTDVSQGHNNVDFECWKLPMLNCKNQRLLLKQLHVNTNVCWTPSNVLWSYLSLSFHLKSRTIDFYNVGMLDCSVGKYNLFAAVLTVPTLR